MARGKKKEELSLEEKLERALVPVEEQPYEVPENWCWTRLSVVSEVVTGSTPRKNKPEYYGNEFPFFKPADLDAGRYTVVASEYLSSEGKSVSRIIPAKSTAVCCIGSIGKSGYLEVDGTTNQQINSVLPKINPLYLYYFINTGMFVNELWKKSSATTISIVNKSKMESNLVPVAPLQEQQRIVEQIERLFSKLDEVKEKVQEVLDTIEDNLEAVLYKAFTGQLTNEWRNSDTEIEKWNDTTLSEVVSGLKYGSSEKSNYEYKGTPVLRIPNIGDGIVDFSDLKYMSEELKNPSHEVFENDILIIRSNGSRDLVGKCAIVPKLKGRYAYASFLIRMKASEKVLPEYLVRFMNSSIARVQLFAKAKSSSGIHNINSKELGAIRISVPPIREQEQILTIIREFVDKEKKVKEIVEMVEDNIDKIKKSILSKAFRGELGTNNPSEESSIELLKRILEQEG